MVVRRARARGKCAREAKANAAALVTEEAGHPAPYDLQYLGERRQPELDDFEPEPAKWNKPHSKRTIICFAWCVRAGSSATFIVERRCDNVLARGIPWLSDTITPGEAEELQAQLQNAVARFAEERSNTDTAIAAGCRYRLHLLGQN